MYERWRARYNGKDEEHVVADEDTEKRENKLNRGGEGGGVCF